MFERGTLTLPFGNLFGPTGRKALLNNVIAFKTPFCYLYFGWNLFSPEDGRTHSLKLVANEECQLYSCVLLT